MQQWMTRTKHFVDISKHIETLLHLSVLTREAARLIKLATKKHITIFKSWIRGRCLTISWHFKCVITMITVIWLYDMHIWLHYHFLNIYFLNDSFSIYKEFVVDSLEVLCAGHREEWIECIIFVMCCIIRCDAIHSVRYLRYIILHNRHTNLLTIYMLLNMCPNNACFATLRWQLTGIFALKFCKNVTCSKSSLKA